MPCPYIALAFFAYIVAFFAVKVFDAIDERCTVQETFRNVGTNAAQCRKHSGTSERTLHKSTPSYETAGIAQLLGR
jgi:hypothetical protein